LFIALILKMPLERIPGHGGEKQKAEQDDLLFGLGLFVHFQGILEGCLFGYEKIGEAVTPWQEVFRKAGHGNAS